MCSEGQKGQNDTYNIAFIKLMTRNSYKQLNQIKLERKKPWENKSNQHNLIIFLK